MTVKQLIDELNKIENKNSTVAVEGILRYPFNHAKIKFINLYNSIVWIVIEGK